MFPLCPPPKAPTRILSAVLRRSPSTHTHICLSPFFPPFFLSLLFFILFLYLCSSNTRPLPLSLSLSSLSCRHLHLECRRLFTRPFPEINKCGPVAVVKKRARLPLFCNDAQPLPAPLRIPSSFYPRTALSFSFLPSWMKCGSVVVSVFLCLIIIIVNLFARWFFFVFFCLAFVFCLFVSARFCRNTIYINVCLFVFSSSSSSFYLFFFHSQTRKELDNVNFF